MDTIKKTGLGESLLLRRTETPPVLTPAEVPDVQTSEVLPQPEPATAAPKPIEIPAPRSVAKKSKKIPLELRDRCTLYLERAVNEQLHMAARIEGRERSEIASEILRKHLPKYRVEREK